MVSSSSIPTVLGGEPRYCSDYAKFKVRVLRTSDLKSRSQLVGKGDGVVEEAFMLHANPILSGEPESSEIEQRHHVFDWLMWLILPASRSELDVRASVIVIQGLAESYRCRPYRPGILLFIDR
jgi:hypothetical protein